MITKKEIIETINKLNLKNKSLLIHSSLKSFSENLENGPMTVIEAFLEMGCTIIVPTFSYDFFIKPPDEFINKYKRNGILDFKNIKINNKIYSSDNNEISKEMGILPKAILEIKGRIRGNHPVYSFTGIGPFASEIIKTQKPMDVFAPLRELTLFNGYALLIGVDLNRLTALYVAEQIVGRKMFIRWAMDKQEGIIEIECGEGCSEGFVKFNNFLNAIEKRIMIRKSLWRLFSLDKLLKKAAQIIKLYPTITCCDRIDCIQCKDLMAGGPIINEI